MSQFIGVAYNFGDVCGWDADLKLFALVECGLGGGAQDGGGTEILDKAG
jgi:hypothetical protein